jgi:pyroglutamyl-peptidase
LPFVGAALFSASVGVSKPLGRLPFKIPSFTVSDRSGDGKVGRMVRPALVTGFMPYGGRGVNPAAEIAAALDGGTLAGTPVVSRLLPVSLAEIAGMAETLLRDLDPCVVVSLGLWPGESLIRIERVALNVADFEIPDNRGYLAVDESVLANCTAAKFATVPVRAMMEALLEAGIPARVSNTAGTFLCNACLYNFLSIAETRRDRVACGFIHVPYLPSQVADLLRRLKDQAALESHQRADTASMDLATGVRAAQLAIETAIRDIS